MDKSTESMVVYDVAVIGAGPAGLTAAMYTSRAGFSTALIEGVSPGGQMATTEHLENYPGFNQSTSGYELSEIMYRQAESFGAQTIYDQVESICVDCSPKRLKLYEGELLANAVIVATGARPAKLGVPGEDDLFGKGVSYCATCDGNFFRGKDVAVVGGGNTAAADAIYLSHICNKITIYVRGSKLAATAIYHEHLFELENVEIVWNTIVTEILPDADGRVGGVKTKSCETGEESQESCSAVFVAVGSTPNSEFLNGQVELDAKGHIVADDIGVTSVAGVFAAGDVRTKRLRQVTTAVADGALCAESAAEYLMHE